MVCVVAVRELVGRPARMGRGKAIGVWVWVGVAVCVGVELG